MNILNIMWAGGAPFASIHKVHQQILSQASPSAVVKTWLLQGQGAECGADVGEVREWRLSSARLKGRHFWRLAKPFMQARFRQALVESDARLVLLDGVGVARTLLPVLKKLAHIRAVVIFHGSARLNAGDQALFQSLPASRLTLVAVSATLADSLTSDLQMPVTPLRSAFDPMAFRAELFTCEQARTRLGLPQGAPVMGAVGRLVSEKGFGYLLDAFAAVRVNRPDLRLVIIGEGSKRAALQQRIEALGLSDSVLLTGHLTEAAQLYRAFDWIAIPSLEEGLGLVMQEAVMAGVPVLCSDLDVFSEQLGSAGWYAPVNDTKAWSEAIDRAFRASSQAINAEQYRMLAPDEAWSSFSQAARALFS
ncbi:glycosyltransferase family 4 protein [Pseudomonas sp. NPDC078863]|jgi:glycosyltransferase involved in cell wall biosynthesis|uniref:glycosyltransferase family 4 protein n=1 Tax=unclassified Pseudomonas TaxID=196821 RepID=UPI0037CAAF21